MEFLNPRKDSDLNNCVATFENLTRFSVSYNNVINLNNPLQVCVRDWQRPNMVRVLENCRVQRYIQRPKRLGFMGSN